MARRTIVLTGDKRLTRMLNALGSKKALAITRKAAKSGAKIVLEEARGLVRVKSGAYRRSLTTRATRRSRKGVGYRVTQRAIGGKKKEFYGAFQELGTKHIDATWQMRTAGKKSEDKVVSLFDSEIERMIEEA